MQAKMHKVVRAFLGGIPQAEAVSMPATSVGIMPRAAMQEDGEPGANPAQPERSEPKLVPETADFVTDWQLCAFGPGNGQSELPNLVRRCRPPAPAGHYS
jgi:hypothetical protein